MESNGQGKNGKGKKGKKAKNRQVKQSSSSALPGSASSSPDGGTLYSLKVVIDLPPPPSYVRDPKYFPKPPFHNNDLVAISAAHWKTSSSSSEFLGVVHSWSPMHGKQGKPPSMLLNLLVCTSKTGVGGDGAGGRGGWMPLKHIQEYVGTTKANSVPVTLSSAGALVTACREFQAVMSLSQMPEGIRRCLLDPSVSKEPKATPATPRSSSFSANSRVGLSSSRGGGADGEGGGADCGEAVVVADAAQCAPPANVPDKLWRSVVQVFNRSQVLAIRKVAEGSPSGFTLLQVSIILSFYHLECCRYYWFRLVQPVLFRWSAPCESTRWAMYGKCDHWYGECSYHYTVSTSSKPKTVHYHESDSS